MIKVVFDLLLAGLTAWNLKEKHKYIDRALALKKDWYEEYNKPVGARDNARLDATELELRLLCETITSALGSENVGSGP